MSSCLQSWDNLPVHWQHTFVDARRDPYSSISLGCGVTKGWCNCWSVFIVFWSVIVGVLQSRKKQVCILKLILCVEAIFCKFSRHWNHMEYIGSGIFWKHKEREDGRQIYNDVFFLHSNIGCLRFVRYNALISRIGLQLRPKGQLVKASNEAGCFRLRLRKSEWLVCTVRYYL